MSGAEEVLSETASKLLESLCDRMTIDSVEAGHWPGPAWQRLVSDGWLRIAVPESEGGAGLGWPEAIGFARLAGYHNAPLPIVEAVLALGLAAEMGCDDFEELTSFAPGLGPDLPELAHNGKRTLNGVLHRVPWGRHADRIAALARDGGAVRLVVADRKKAEVRQSQNLAGEPRDTLTFQNVPTAFVSEPLAQPQRPPAFLALARASQMAGALQRVMELTVAYANDRKQFGRPIGKFQAIQQQLAVLAEQASAADSAVRAAILSLGTDRAVSHCAAAKIRAGEAASAAAAIAHGVHAAIGFTREHALQLSTRRLWSWRDEAGNEAYWANQLGREVCALSGSQLWPWLTGQISKTKGG